jgi:hypothetical protein
MDPFPFFLRQLQRCARSGACALVGLSVVSLAAASAGGGEPAVSQPWTRHTIDNTSRGADGVRWADVDGDGRLDIASAWEEGGQIRLYRCPSGDAVRQPWPQVTVGQVPVPEDAFCADLDRDGRLDVISCSEGRQRQICIAFGPADASPFSATAAWKLLPLSDPDPPQAWMYAIAGQWDGQHGGDLIAGSKNEGASVTLWRSPAEPRQLDRWHKQRLRDAGWIMSLIACDMDGDGDDDVLLSDRRGPRRGVSWLENPGAAAVRAAQLWPEHALGGHDREVMFVGPADLNGDGRTEWIAATLDACLLVLEPVPEPDAGWTSWTIPLPGEFRRGKAVASGDLDGDRRPDLVLTTEDGCVAWLANAQAARRDPPVWRQINGREGYKFDRVELRDLDGDGDLDIVTCEERDGLGVVWYENPL